MAETNWDKIVRYWLRDVPYIWKSGNSWKNCHRVYIFPYETQLPKDLLPHCKNNAVNNYFSFKNSKSVYIKNKTLRINGLDIYFPDYYKNTITTNIIYNFLGIEKPRDFMILKKNMIIFPKEKILTPKPLKMFSPSIKTPYEHKIRLKKDNRQLNLLLWMMTYMNKKNTNVCIPVSPEGAKIGSSMDSRSLNVKISGKNFYWSEKKVIPDFRRIVKMCIKSDKIKTILIDLGIFYEDDNIGHDTLMVINKQKGGKVNIYHFDPWGKAEKEQIISKVMRFVVKELDLEKLDLHFNYFHSSDICPARSFQNLEVKEFRKGDYGFCEIWVLWMMDVIISNPETDIEELPRKALNQLSMKHPDFRKFVRRYAKHIEDYGKKLKKEKGLRSSKDLYPAINRIYNQTIRFLK